MKQKVLFISAFLWIGAISTFISLTHSWHFLAFKDVPSSVGETISKFSSSERKSLNIVHFLTPSCSCSKIIKENLLGRKSLNSSELSEKVVLIDDFDGSFSKKLKEKGFEVINFNYQEISKQMPDAINAVPLLVIYDTNGILKYGGGYDQFSITPFTKINIAKIITEIKSNQDPKAYPIKGCAVSRKYQSLLDPLGVKYVSRN